MILTNLRRQIVGLMNDAQVPIDMIYFMMKDIMNEVELIYTNELRKEQDQLFQELAEDQKENNTEEEQNSSSSND